MEKRETNMNLITFPLYDYRLNIQGGSWSLAQTQQGFFSGQDEQLLSEIRPKEISGLFEKFSIRTNLTNFWSNLQKS